MNAATFDRLIQVQRAIYGDDGLSRVALGWENYGTPIFTRRRDISDQERFASGHLQSALMTRFMVRNCEFTRSIRPSDRIIHSGYVYQIDGIKEVIDSRAFIEITAITDRSKP